MDDNGISSAPARRRSRVDGQPRNKRRIWSRRGEDFLLNAMKELVMDPKWKLDNGAFRNGFYSELERKIVQGFAGTDLRATPHIDSKIKLWKRHFSMLQDMLKTSGIGWDDERKMIQIDSEDVWANYLLKEPDVASMRNKEFPYYKDWIFLFGRDRATGEGAEAMSESATNILGEDASFNLSQDFDAVILETGDGSQGPQHISHEVPATSRGGKKRGRANEGAAKALADIATSFGFFCTETGTRLDKIANALHIAQDVRTDRKRLDDELKMLPLNDEDRLSVVLEMYDNDKLFDIFFSFKDEASRMRLVRRILTNSASMTG